MKTWTAEGVLALNDRLWHYASGASPSHLDNVAKAQRYLNDYAERLKADESAVPVAWIVLQNYGQHQGDVFRTEKEAIDSIVDHQIDRISPLYLHPAAQAAQAVVPDGWVLVPREPTDEMVDEGLDVEVPSNAYHHGDIKIGRRAAIECYKAMTDAAPTPPQGDRHG